jgi:holo-[acyl-carrier protein] synthase
MCDRQARIVGIGTDMCTVSRIAKAIEKEHFYQSVYLDGERAYISTKGRGKAESAAAMFAAKEAVAKALGTGFAKGVGVAMIEVTHDELGAPGVLLHEGAKERLAAIGGKRVLLSLTHEGDMAMAFVVIEG